MEWRRFDGYGGRLGRRRREVGWKLSGTFGGGRHKIHIG